MTSPSIRPADRWMIAGCAVLLLLKLWLVSAQTIQALGGSYHDDRLFLRLTAHLLGGNWLGDYNQLTLAKGPAFSLFAAGSFLLGLPLTTAQFLLHAAACVLLVLAIRPVVASRILQWAFFALLLFNPVTYDAHVHGRVLRQNITPGVSLLIVAALIALYVRRDRSPRQLAGWAVLLGVAGPFFTLIREDGVWIAPTVVISMALTCWKISRDPFPMRLHRLGIIIALPLALYTAGLTTVAAINWHCYGVFTTCEFREPSFKAAYGALTRVTPAVWHPRIPVSRETRERLYEVSPAFVELRPYLEGKLGEDWALHSVPVLQLPLEDREMAGGWFMWTLRDAVTLAGHGDSGADARAFYQRLADEINTACENNLIEAGPRRSGFLPPWNRAYLEPVAEAAFRSARLQYGFLQLHARPGESIGTAERLLLFSDITHDRIAPVAGEPRLHKRRDRLDATRIAILDTIGGLYRWFMPWLLPLALLATCAGVVRSLYRRETPYFGLLGVGVAGSTFALVMMTALIDTTSFPAVHPIYLTGGYGFCILFIGTSWLAVREGFTGTRSKETPAKP